MAENNNTPTRLNYHHVASILVEAMFYGDRRVAEKQGITTRTIRNYRARLETDENLSVLFHEKKEQFLANWAEDIPIAIRAGIQFIQRAANEADHKSPETIHAVAGAIKILAEIGITKEIIDAKLNGYSEN